MKICTFYFYSTINYNFSIYIFRFLYINLYRYFYFPLFHITYWKMLLPLVELISRLRFYSMGWLWVLLFCSQHHLLRVCSLQMLPYIFPRNFNSVKKIRNAFSLSSIPSSSSYSSPSTSQSNGLQDQRRNQSTSCSYAHNFYFEPEEKDIINLLKSYSLRHPSTTIRIAGGWVRDKILNVTTKPDIDIAIDDMSGVAFARKFANFTLKASGLKIELGIIQSNPEKSKHLETAAFQLGKYSIDIVNLRTERYTEESRIPEIQIGTPSEDAYRRDLTINALFYNVNEDIVEDFTGLGLQGTDSIAFIIYDLNFSYGGCDLLLYFFILSVRAFFYF